MIEDSIRPYLFEGEITLRVIVKNDLSWFVLVDVCRALGLTNPAEVARGLDDDERGISSADTPGGHQELLVVSESGLFSLIFKSRTPDAIKFRRWVTTEVLPSIRQTARYVSGHACGTVGPWLEKPLEERRQIISEITTARLTFNRGAAMWLWSYHGLPTPPREFLPAWVQGDLLTPTIHTTN